MKTILFGVLAILGTSQTCFTQVSNITEFFRISSPSNAVILNFDPAWGTISWSNEVAGATNQLQRAYTLNSSNWVDFVQLVSTNGDAAGTECIIDLEPPEDMVLIPGGLFQMGDSFGEHDVDELPIHSVYITSFYIGKYEVTKQLWDEVYNWATNNGYAFDNLGLGKASNHPVHSVSWYDCVKWCNARSEKEGWAPCYTASGSVYRSGQVAIDCDWTANGYRLPSEAEWEKVSRGGLNGKRFGWGDLITHDDANYESSSSYAYDVSPTRGYHPDYDDGINPYTSPVGSFEPNGFGVHDMAGNLWEWCWDWYDSGYYAVSPMTDPKGSASGSYRVSRGCAWSNGYSLYCRCAARWRYTQTFVYYKNGFRICQNVKRIPKLLMINK